MAIPAGSKPYILKTSLTKAGQDSEDKKDNTFMFATNHEIGDDDLATMALEVCNTMAKILHPSTQITNWVLGPCPKRGERKDEAQDYMDDGVNIVGTRVVAAGSTGTALTECAAFTKRGTYGRGGTLLVRGVYGQDEVDVNKGFVRATKAGFDDTPLTKFATDIDKVFAKYSAGMVLPAPKTKDWETEWRPLKKLTYVGLRERQLRNHRKSLTQEQEDVFRREMNQLERQSEAVLETLGAGYDILKAAKFLFGVVEPVVRAFGSARVISALPKVAKSTPTIVKAIELLALAA